MSNSELYVIIKIIKTIFLLLYEVKEEENKTQ